MSQLDELDRLFGRKASEPAEADAEPVPERLEIYVTTNKVDSYRLIAVGLPSALPTLPLILGQVHAAIMRYAAPPPMLPEDEHPDTPRD